MPTPDPAVRAGEPADAPSADPVDETPVASPVPLRQRELVWTKRYLVLPAWWGECVRNCRGINLISLELVLRGTQEKCPHNPNEIRAFDPELVLRDVPGKLA
jgi:hypothetical protein